ncbi:uncharacterized protein LOC116209984 [Punica granatum]|uniref:DUF4408 domain-containing protein n=2 Tax=Punica granatum TaxID=22663 RepID=A0A218WW74_PUNGR|nr:uncharacterized protein LOC116209984 [Punica granatum]OWM76232.1 hypothetical protein CDL15_Pgr009878 [Punica granatum]PKI76973.1 hypothetical protein CRG98_002476 [Punica granatum]
MDPTTAKKLRAMKMSKRRSNFQFVYNLILQLLIAIACTFFCSYSFWFPLAKQFLLISLPSVNSYLLCPKCLFVVANVIVITLVGESKLRGSKGPSPGHEIYDEYVRRSRSGVVKHPIISSNQKEVRKEEELMVCLVDEKKGMEETVSKDVEEKEFTSEIESCVENKGEEKEEDDELPNEELNRRIEEFIARVNRQRWLEARSLMNLPTQNANRNIAVCG